MGYYLFTVDAGVRFCFCSVGVGVLSYDLARRNYLVELWTVLSGKERCLFLLLCCWDPNVCIASCDSIDKIGLKMTDQ